MYAYAYVITTMATTIVTTIIITRDLGVVRVLVWVPAERTAPIRLPRTPNNDDNNNNKNK